MGIVAGGDGIAQRAASGRGDQTQVDHHLQRLSFRAGEFRAGLWLEGVPAAAGQLHPRGAGHVECVRAGASAGDSRGPGRGGTKDGRIPAEDGAGSGDDLPAARENRREKTGGWNIFPNQDNLDVHSSYSSTLALLALLETHSANQPWQGSVQKRDELLKQTAEFLISRFVKVEQGFGGWRQSPSLASAVSEGLTLQIYAELLRAEQQTGLRLPGEMLEEISKHLADMNSRTKENPYDAGEFIITFKSHTGEAMKRNESINFLWHSWAIEAAVRWLNRSQSAQAPREDIVRVRRALGHLVVDLSEPMRQKAVEGESFIGGETLLGYSVVPMP
jgi:hypothetical protein